MAWTPPGAGALRARVRFDRRASQANVAGDVLGDWAQVGFTVSGELIPVGNQSESVIAAKLSGTALYRLTVRQNSFTRTLDTDCRAVDADDTSRTFNVRSIEDPDGRRAWLVLMVEAGVADG